MKVEIRRATAADIDALVPLYRAAYDTLAELGYPSGMQEVAAADLRSWFEPDTPSAEFVAVAEGEIVGVIRVLESRETPFIERLAVPPEAQGDGIGATLLDRAERYVEEKGDDRVTLGTVAGHPFLPAFYESRGYERFTVWENEGRDYDIVGYEKRL